MPVERKTINLEVKDNSLVATDAATGLAASDAGVQGEDGAVVLHAAVPDDWADLDVRLQVLSPSGSCDESGLAAAGTVDLPLRAIVTAPGRLSVALTGVGKNGVRRSAACDGLFISEQDCPVDPVAQLYPTAFESLSETVAHDVVHRLTGSGGAKVTRTDDTTYNIGVSGTGGDMLAANYAAGAGKSNADTVDHALYADTTGAVESTAHADRADSAAAAETAAPGSALETELNSKQPALTPGGSGGVDILSGTTVKSLKGDGLTLSADGVSVTLGLDGALATAGVIAFFPESTPPAGWQLCDGRQLLISDYPDLYAVVSNRFGQGSATYVDIVPTYFTDNANLAGDIVLQKYTNSVQYAAFFGANGTVFTGADLRLTGSGNYTLYCKDSKGREFVQYLYVPGISAPFLLNAESQPITSDLKLKVIETTLGETSAVSLVRLAQGIQNVAYFAGNGMSIGTADGSSETFQDGTSCPSGIYTFYCKDAAGREAIQYFNVAAQASLSSNLTMSLGSDYFKLPNLLGSIGSQIYPVIKT